MVKTTMQIKQFLVDEVYSYFEKAGFPSAKDSYLEKANTDISSSFYKIARWMAPFLQKVSAFWIRRMGSKDITVLYHFDPRLYPDIVSTVSEHANLLIHNPFRCISHMLDPNKGIFFSPIVLAERCLNNGIVNDDDALILEGVHEIRRMLLTNMPDVIVINDSVYPVNRALILVARELKIPTVEIQHGCYALGLPMIESCADYVFVWGDCFKQMYLDQEIKKSESLKVLGLPYALAETGTDVNKQRTTVCYLAQGFEDIDIHNLDILLENALKLKQVCDQNDMDFQCRLHPNSSPLLLEKILPRVACVPKSEKLIDTIKNGDIFIAFNSTSLIEAALHGKLCIQIRNFPVITDNFEQLGICPESYDTIEDVEKYLKKVSRCAPADLKRFYKQVNPEYINIPKPHSGVRFMELIHEVLSENAWVSRGDATC